MRRLNLRSWRTAVVMLAGSAAVAIWATGSLAASHASVVKLAIMTDCKGAFGFGYEPDIGGAQAAFAQFAHGKPRNNKKPSAGMTGITAGGAQVKIVGYGCGDDTPATALKETRRLMEQLGADVMLGPLSGDEAVAIANWAKTHPTKTVVVESPLAPYVFATFHPSALLRLQDEEEKEREGPLLHAPQLSTPISMPRPTVPPARLK